MKLLKVMGSLLGGVILLCVIGFLLLVTFVSPNRFKPLIINQVKVATGRDLTMDGDLSWTFFPYLGVKVGHLVLNNTKTFQEKVFAEIDNATIAIKLVPLLHSKIESNGITIHGLKLNLIKNTKGKTNWEDLPNHNPSAKKEDASSSLSTTQKTSLALAISGIDITDAKINWQDDTTTKHIFIDNAELHAKNISFNKHFSLQTQFHFEIPKENTSGQVALTSKVLLDLPQQMISLDKLKLVTSIHQNAKNFPISLEGDVTIDNLNEKIQVKHLVGNIANLKILGNVNVANLKKTPQTKGHLNVPPFDVKKWLQVTGQDVSAFQSLKNLSGDFDFSVLNSLRSVDLTGDVNMDEVTTTSGIHINQVKVKTRFANGILNLAPITASFYQGTLNGNTKINLNSSLPQIALQAKLNGVEASPLLADLGAAHSKFKFTGTGNMDLKVTTSGDTSDTIIKNLSGKTIINFNNGTLEGIDLGYWVDSAYALGNKSISPGTNTEKTQFGTLNGTIIIRNGILNNNDLTLDSSRFTSKGTGVINLVNRTLQYRIQTISKQNENRKNNITNLYGLPIPILISGALNNPTVQLDTTVLMKAIAARQVEKVKTEVQEKIAEKIKDKIPGKAGELLKNFLGQ